MRLPEDIAWMLAGLTPIMVADLFHTIRYKKSPLSGLSLSDPMTPSIGFFLIVWAFARLFGAFATLFFFYTLKTPLSPPINIFIGAAAPLLLERIAKIIPPSLESDDSEREIRINKEAERLAIIRSSYPDASSPQGVSADVADILDAMREDLVGQLPVVDSGEERSA
jgi:hypothetical protein